MTTWNPNSPSNKPYKPYNCKGRRKGQGNSYRGEKKFRPTVHRRERYNHMFPV